MGIRVPSTSGIGLVNNTYPLWGMGAVLYWKCTNPMVVQTPGGVGSSTFTISDSGGVQGSPFAGWDPTRLHYKYIVDLVSGMPKSGFFSGTRYNYYDSSETSATRGFTFDAGLTVTTPAIPADHIMDPLTFPMATLVNLANTSGSAQHCWQSNTSTTGTRGWGVLLKRDDGAAITAATATLFISTTDPVGAITDVASATIYKQIRGDGWYELMCTTTDLTSPLFFGIQIEDGVTVDVEMPCIEGLSSGVTDGCSFPNTTSGAGTRIRRVPQIRIRREDSDATGLEGFSNCGWIACTVVHPFDAATFTLPFGIYVVWESATTDYIQAQTYSTTEEPAIDMDSAGVDQLFLDTNVPVTFGQQNGIVFSWGSRLNSKLAYLFINGKYVESDSVWSLPTGTPTEIKIGFKQSYSSPGYVWVQTVAVGRNYLSRSECRALSLWFQNQAIHSLG